MIDFTEQHAKIAASKADFLSEDDGEGVRGALGDVAEAVDEALTAVQSAVNGADPTVVKGSLGATDSVLEELGFRTLMQERKAGNESGLYSLFVSHLYADGHTVSISSNPKFCRTACISQNRHAIVTLGLADYAWLIISYNAVVNPPSASNKTRGNTGDEYVVCDQPVMIRCTEDDKCIVIGFCRVDGGVLTTDPDDPTSDFYKIRNALHFYTFHDNADVEALSWTFGGLSKSGADYISNENRSRLRLLNAVGRGGIILPAGTRISVSDGYKFNAAVYSRYVRNGNPENVLYAAKAMNTDDYTMPIDGAVRISVGRTDNAALWYVDAQNIRRLTNDAPDAVSDVISFDFSGAGSGESLDARISTLETLFRDAGSGVERLDDAIPINATAYHALWSELTAWTDVAISGIGSSAAVAMRVKIGNGRDITGAEDTNLPIYLYALRFGKAHMNPTYGYTPWDGSNELYKKPCILITSGVHGDERATPYAVYDLARRLLNDPNYAQMLAGFDWYFVPVVNPWGYSKTLLENGAETGGSSYSAEIRQEILNGASAYSIVDNTSSRAIGIRQLASGSDPNRDMGNFNYAETSALRDAVAAVAAFINAENETETFQFAIDAHQAGLSGDALTNVCAFASLQTDVAAATKQTVFDALLRAGYEADALIKNWLGITDDTQTVLPWSGTTNPTVRNYMAAYTAASICFEGSENCTIFSQLTGFANWSNPIARAAINTVLHAFIRKLAEG